MDVPAGFQWENGVMYDLNKLIPPGGAFRFGQRCDRSARETGGGLLRCFASQHQYACPRRVQCARSDSSFTRVSTSTQFASQVLPPSSENDCSKRHESAVMSEKTFRTRMLLSLNGSISKNSPSPFLNSPIVGTPRVPSVLLAELRLHWWLCGSYRPRDRDSR